MTVELTGESGALRLVKSEDVDATVLVGDGIEAPDADQVLQLWAIADGQPASMGTFVPDDDGHVAFVMEGTEPEGVLYAVTDRARRRQRAAHHRADLRPGLSPHPSA